MSNAPLSPDGQVIALLAWPYVESGAGAPASTSPFTPSEVYSFLDRAQTASLSLAELLEGDAVKTWCQRAELSLTEYDRIQALLSRAGTWAIEMERLESLGIWVATIADAGYPQRLKERLARHAPPLLFIAGETLRGQQEAVAIIGSRDVDEPGAEFAYKLAERCAEEGLRVVSGGARGVDKIALGAAFESGGTVAAVLPGQMEQMLHDREVRESVADGRLTLLSPYHPRAPFTVGGAMGRNKLIYGLANYAVVVASAANEGGTWSGATENLKRGWTPLFVRDVEGAPEGNLRLVAMGAVSLTPTVLQQVPSLHTWFETHAPLPAPTSPAPKLKRRGRKKADQGPYTPDLFGEP